MKENNLVYAELVKTEVCRFISTRYGTSTIIIFSFLYYLKSDMLGILLKIAK